MTRSELQRFCSVHVSATHHSAFPRVNLFVNAFASFLMLFINIAKAIWKFHSKTIPCLHLSNVLYYLALLDCLNHSMVMFFHGVALLFYNAVNNEVTNYIGMESMILMGKKRRKELFSFTLN